MITERIDLITINSGAFAAGEDGKMDCGSKDCKGYSESHKNNCTASDTFDEPDGCVGYTPLTTKKDAVAKSPACNDGLEGDDCKEASAKMDKKEALAIMAGANEWLRKRLNEGATCTCGACYLCAYRFIEEAL